MIEELSTALRKDEFIAELYSKRRYVLGLSNASRIDSYYYLAHSLLLVCLHDFDSVHNYSMILTTIKPLVGLEAICS